MNHLNSVWLHNTFMQGGKDRVFKLQHHKTSRKAISFLEHVWHSCKKIVIDPCDVAFTLKSDFGRRVLLICVYVCNIMVCCITLILCQLSFVALMCQLTVAAGT